MRSKSDSRPSLRDCLDEGPPKLRYFDLGLYRCTEMCWMREEILPLLKIVQYEIYGFEACLRYAESASRMFNGDPRITIVHSAIGGEDGETKLYHAGNGLGHSVFETKFNINREDFEYVPISKFSTWARSTGLNLSRSFNIMKVNIEGAEWDLFKDLESSGLLSEIDVICGEIGDVRKIGAYEGRVHLYEELLVRNEVRCLPFSEGVPGSKDLLKEVLVEEIN